MFSTISLILIAIAASAFFVYSLRIFLEIRKSVLIQENEKRISKRENKINQWKNHTQDTLQNGEENLKKIGSAPGLLPPGWERSITPEGVVYYIDHNTHSTTWNPPPPPPLSSLSLSLSSSSCSSSFPPPDLIVTNYVHGNGNGSGNGNGNGNGNGYEYGCGNRNRNGHGNGHENGYGNGQTSSSSPTCSPYSSLPPSPSSQNNNNTEPFFSRHREKEERRKKTKSSALSLSSTSSSSLSATNKAGTLTTNYPNTDEASFDSLLMATTNSRTATSAMAITGSNSNSNQNPNSDCNSLNSSPSPSPSPSPSFSSVHNSLLSPSYAQSKLHSRREKEKEKEKEKEREKEKEKEKKKKKKNTEKSERKMSRSYSVGNYKEMNSNEHYVIRHGKDRSFDQSYANDQDYDLMSHDQRSHSVSNLRLLNDVMNDIPLPEGWERAYTPEGHVYYINHQERSTTWIDPRTQQSEQGTQARILFNQYKKGNILAINGNRSVHSTLDEVLFIRECVDSSLV